MNTLDNILSGSEAAPANEQEQVTRTETATEGQQTEGQTEQQTETSEQEGQTQGTKTVPHEALHAEKQKVKRYTEEVSSLRKEISDRDAAWERRIAQLVEAQKPKQEAPKPPDFFEDPAAATTHHVNGQVAPQFQQINQTLLAFAKDNAITRFTEEAVNEAETAFIAAMQSGKLDQADYHKVVGSPNRYAAAVQWHKRQLAQAEIGDDPAAFRAKLEAELREKITAELNGGQQQQTQQRAAPVMPNNLAGARNVGARSGPAWSGPQSLQDIFNRTPASN